MMDASFFPSRAAILAALLLIFSSVVMGQQTIKKEIDVSFAPIETVRPVLKSALSPGGKFVMLPNKGSVLVIDTPESIRKAEAALASSALPVPMVAMDFQFVTGLPPRNSSITVAQEVPFPIEYAPPTIMVGPNGPFGVVPATPTRFIRRNIGVTSETSSRLNPDGSITMDINTEHTEFDGFINYGSAILPGGAIGTVPVLNPVGDPVFFQPFLNSGDILLPVISTTRISTSIVIRPRVTSGVVQLDLMPRLTVEVEEPGAEDQVVDLKQFHTTLGVQNGQTGRVYGFDGASEEFNRHFLGAKDPHTDQSSAIVVKAVIKPGEAPVSAEKETPEESVPAPTAP